MISSSAKSINLNDYKEGSEEFIYGVKGIVRLSIGREIIYRIAYASMFDIIVETPHIFRIECIFAVTDKKIILIPTEDTYTSISFNYQDIEVTYYNQLFDKVFLLNIKNKNILNFKEDKLVFRMYLKQEAELNKINCVLQEHACA